MDLEDRKKRKRAARASYQGPTVRFSSITEHDVLGVRSCRNLISFSDASTAARFLSLGKVVDEIDDNAVTVTEPQPKASSGASSSRRGGGRGAAGSGRGRGGRKRRGRPPKQKAVPAPPLSATVGEKAVVGTTQVKVEREESHALVVSDPATMGNITVGNTGLPLPPMVAPHQAASGSRRRSISNTP